MRPSPSSGTRSSASTSCTTTWPWKRRANSGRTSDATCSPAAPAEACRHEDRLEAGRDAEPLQLVDVASSASCRGSRTEPGTGSAGASTTIVARFARRDEHLERAPREREAQRVAHRRAHVGDRVAGRRGGAARRRVAGRRRGSGASRTRMRHGARHAPVSQTSCPEPDPRAVDSKHVAEDVSGAELELDDAPARATELFLVDGNNLAYRAFYALPEDIATSDGLPHERALGFTSMLLKLLADYKPRGVAVAWDTRPVHREQILEAYKGHAQADARPAARAVPALPPARRGLRLHERRVRGLGGRRRDRHARHARRARPASRPASSRPTATPSSSSPSASA